MTPLALYAQRLSRRQARHNRLPSRARTTKPYYCQRCDAIFFTAPFISCKDGHTKICSDCSLIEGLETSGIKAPYDGPQHWTIEQRLRATAAEGLATSTHKGLDVPPDEYFKGGGPEELQHTSASRLSS